MSSKLTPTKNKRVSAPSYTREQKLNAFLHIYDVYKNFVAHYLDNPRNPGSNDMNVFYMRELVPTIQAMARDLGIDGLMAADNLPSPLNYTPYKTLFEIEVVLRNQGKNSEEGRQDLYYIFSQIKTLVEDLRAVGQTEIPEIEKVVKEAKEKMMEKSDTETELSPRDIPHFICEREKWYISTGKNKKVLLFEEGTLRGELLGVLNDGVERLKENVHDILGEKTGDVPDLVQITDAMKDINRKLKKNKIPPLDLVDRKRYWQLLFKENHQ